jgi:hypothetical protein
VGSLHIEMEGQQNLIEGYSRRVTTISKKRSYLKEEVILS